MNLGTQEHLLSGTSFDAQPNRVTGITQDIRNAFAGIISELLACMSLESYTQLREGALFPLHVLTIAEYVDQSANKEGIQDFLPSEDIRKIIDAQIFVLNIVLGLIMELLKNNEYFHDPNEYFHDPNEYFLSLKKQAIAISKTINSILNGTIVSGEILASQNEI